MFFSSSFCKVLSYSFRASFDLFVTWPWRHANGWPQVRGKQTISSSSWRFASSVASRSSEQSGRKEVACTPHCARVRSSDHCALTTIIVLLTIAQLRPAFVTSWAAVTSRSVVIWRHDVVTRLPLRVGARSQLKLDDINNSNHQQQETLERTPPIVLALKPRKT